MLRYEHPECDPALQLGLSVPTKEPELPPCIIHGKEAHIGDICCVVVRNYKRLGTGDTFRRIYDVYVPDSAVAYNRELLLERCNQFLGQ